MNRSHHSSESPWEEIVGYSRAIKVGNLVEVAGTTATNYGRVIAPNDAYAQTVFIIQKIETALKALGSELKDVIRTRMYVPDISLWEEIGRAHGEFFRDIKPVSTMVEVSALIDPGLLIEMEVTAIVPDEPSKLRPS